MVSITGISRIKFIFLSVVHVLICSLLFVFVHLLLPAEIGSLPSNILILLINTISTLTIFIFLRKQYIKHGKILKNIINSINDVVIIKNYKGEFLFCNKTVAKLYNSSPEKMLGKDDYYFTKDKKQADFFRENVQSIMDRFEKLEVYESTTDSKTGEIRHFQSIKVPYRDAKDDLNILVVAKDITDITKLKEEADRNKVRLEQALDVSQEGLWEWNARTDQVLHNRQWELITGIKRSDNSFKEFEGCILSEDKEKVRSALGMLMKYNQSYSIEFRMKRPDGEIIWIWDRGKVAEYDEEGNPLWLVGIAQDITTEKLNQEKIVQLAYFDQLTGLVNRTQFEIELQKAAKFSEQDDVFSALLFLDIDRFKLLNDSFGHDIGDKLLQSFAERLSQFVGPNDSIGRFGGDEFVVLLAGSNTDDNKVLSANRATEVSANILKSFEQPFQLGKYEYSCSASIGITVFSSEPKGLDELLKQADMAMYDAKSAGRNTVRFFDPEMQAEAQNRTILEADLKRDVTAKKLHLYYQPQINSRGKLTGAEILLRWPHQDRGMISPAEFIPIAESTGLILPIGQCILETACKQLALWATDQVMSELVLSVNVSPVQLHCNNFVQSVLSALEKTGAPANMLKLEITESMLVRDLDEAIEKMACLRDHGVRFSLDDFGTGYSSLSYLKKLPLDQLKIDQSFVRDILDEPNDVAIVKMIVALGNTLGLSVIAEGVETEQQQHLLEELGCYSFQGYLFARPMPLKDFDLFSRSFGRVAALSDKPETDSRGPLALPVMPHKNRITQQERRCGSA